MPEKTLVDKILLDCEIKLENSTVNIPKLGVNKQKKHNNKNKNQKIEFIKDDNFQISSIIKFMIANLIEKAKMEENEKKEIKQDKEGKITEISDKETKIPSGGYGTIQKNYGTMPQSSYADYGKLFSYLGKFRSQSPYEFMSDNHLEFLNKSGESGSFTLIDRETMETGARYVRYLKSPVADLTSISLVPIGGMGSGDWEQFKLWMKLDPVMYRLKTSTS